jgi:hypothetical protein
MYPTGIESREWNCHDCKTSESFWRIDSLMIVGGNKGNGTVAHIQETLSGKRVCADCEGRRFRDVKSQNVCLLWYQNVLCRLLFQHILPWIDRKQLGSWSIVLCIWFDGIYRGCGRVLCPSSPVRNAIAVRRSILVLLLVMLLGCPHYTG